MFLRWIELPKTRSFLLLGPRRAGKSTLLKAVFPDYRYVTLDDLDFLEQAKSDPKNFIESLGRRLIVDEAQRAPEITLPVKKLIDEKEAHIILTGSTGMNLRQKAADTLAGRIEILQLPPCCFGEEDGASTHGLTEPPQFRDAKAGKRRLREYLDHGGFPEVISQADAGAREEILRNYKNTYFTRDLAQMCNLENIEALKALFQALIRGIGSRVEISAISKEISLSVPSTKKYLHTLLESGLAFKLYGYHMGPAKRYISAAKTYLCDNGIVTSLSDDASSGQKFENFVISEIEKRRRIGQIRCDELFYYESVSGREIDLVIDEKERITVIEIKSSKSVSARDLRNLREFMIPGSKKTLRRVLVYRGEELKKIDGITLLPGHFLYRARWD